MHSKMSLFMNDDKYALALHIQFNEFNKKYVCREIFLDIPLSIGIPNYMLACFFFLRKTIIIVFIWFSWLHSLECLYRQFENIS